MSDDNANTENDAEIKKSNTDLQNKEKEVTEKDLFAHPQHVELLGNGQQKFAIKLYEATRGDSLLPNMVICPLGVAAMMTMTLCGATEDTASQITNVLSLDTVDDSGYINLAYCDILGSISKMPGATMHLANRMYIQEQFRAESDFLAILQRYYNTAVSSVDFMRDVDRIRCQINSWVEDQTSKKVKELISSGGLDHLSRSVLITTSYYSGTWFRKFYHDHSHPGKFFTDKDHSVPMDMIQQQGRYPYTNSKALRCSVVELPYTDKRLTFLIFLPKEVGGLGTVESKLTPELFETTIKALKPATVNITMPKFTIESFFSMSDNLSKMGASDMFTRKKAKLTGMAVHGDGKEETMHVSAVYHKAVLEIGESGGKGTVEVPVANSSCFCRQSVIPFNADHPFIFVIRDTMSGMIFFIGRIREPPPPRKG